MKWFYLQKGSTHWSKQNGDCVSKSPVFLFYKLIFSDGQGEWVYNFMNRQKKFVLINRHCLNVLKQTQFSSFQRIDVAQIIHGKDILKFENQKA